MMYKRFWNDDLQNGLKITVIVIWIMVTKYVPNENRQKFCKQICAKIKSANVNV